MPEYKEVGGNGAPKFIKRDTKWVAKVMTGVHHIPFSKFKTTFADITEDEARAKGYITGHRKKEEVFGLLRRTTDATTVYKKQKMDRDNVVEITSFDVIAWLKTEMRMMLDEELARAFLIGDGRSVASSDKINEQIDAFIVQIEERLLKIKLMSRIFVRFFVMMICSLFVSPWLLLRDRSALMPLLMPLLTAGRTIRAAVTALRL